jgi:hypothetical protein
VSKCLVLVVVALAGSGCISPRAYFADRWADAKDVFTASVGTGGGVKARVGPINAGLFVDSDVAGLRGGEGFFIPGDFNHRAGLFEDIDYVVLAWGVEGFTPQGNWSLRERGKSFDAYGIVFFRARPGCYSYYTQIEVAAGAGGTLRLGFNPGELLDFVLGWFGLDIYGDDLNARKEREEEKKAKEPLPVPPPPATPIPTPIPTPTPAGS